MSSPATNDLALILKKLENIERLVQTNSQITHNSLNDVETELKALYAPATQQQNTNAINGFFASKEQMVKDEVRKFMLANFNIQALDDKIEGEIYDFIVDKVWDLTVGHFI